MKHFKVFKKRDGGKFIENDTIYADNLQEARVLFARKKYNSLISGSFGDDFSYENDKFIKEIEEDGQDVAFYEGEGVYFVDGEEKSAFLLLKDVEKGIDYFSVDVFTWTIRE